jgi:hypothetical protein
MFKLETLIELVVELIRVLFVEGVPKPTTVAKPAKIRQLKQKRFSMPRSTGAISRLAGIANVQDSGVADLDLPFGMPRFVNAATLKQMFRASPADLLLKKCGVGWEVCENSLIVDLTDDSVEFRLGPVQILS